MPTNSEKNKEICEELWIEFEPRLRQICNLKLTNHPSEVDDILSEAFLILLNALHDGKTISNYKNWLYGTVNNLIKSKYEQINKEKTNQISLYNRDNELMYEMPYFFDYLDRIINDLMIEQYVEEIEGVLSKEETELFRLNVEEKKSYQELAEYYNSSPVAVKQRVYRLKKKIRKLANMKIEDSY